GTAADATAAGAYDLAGSGAWQRLSTPMTWSPTADRTGVVLAAYDSTGTAAFRLDDAVVWDGTVDGSNRPLYQDVDVPTSETVYDATGAITATVAPPGAPGADEPMVTTTARDTLGRPTAVTVDAVAGGGTSGAAVNLATATAYDRLGRATGSTDPRGIVTTYSYDRLGDVRSTVQDDVAAPDGGQYSDQDVTSRFGYDSLGELTGYCPAAAVWGAGGCDETSGSDPKAWHYAYDAAGHLAAQTPPVNQTATALASTRWEYDAGGRLAASCDTTAPASTCAAGGASVARTVVPAYDGVGRTVRLDTYQGAGTGTLALRTATTDYLGDGSPAEARYSTGTAPTLQDAVDYGYDHAGRLTSLARGGTTIAAQGWNADGTLASRTDGDGGAVGTTTFGYDWAKRLVSAALPAAFGSAAPTWSWRADGLLGARTLASGGAPATVSYDAAKRPTGLAMGPLTLGQAYDRDGNVVSESRTLPGVAGDAGSGTQAFTYDGLNRVRGSTGLSVGYTYTYDRDGNRATQTAGGVAFTYTYDRTDELVQVQKSGQAAQSFAYDGRGNLTGDAETGLAVTAYAYDLGNRLTAVDAAGTASDASYAYDALGRLRTRTVNGTADAYSYAGATSEAARIATAGTSLDSVVDPSGDRLAAASGGGWNWLLPDPHGSLAATLSADQSTVTSATRYDAWGDTVATGSAGGTAVGGSAWRYRGRLDVSPPGLSTPLYAMGARLYDPGVGAFTSLDTFSGTPQAPLSMNRYLYAAADPATLVDPDGHSYIDEDGTGETIVSTVRRSAASDAGYRRRQARWDSRAEDDWRYHRTATAPPVVAGASAAGLDWLPGIFLSTGRHLAATYATAAAVLEKYPTAALSVDLPQVLINGVADGVQGIPEAGRGGGYGFPDIKATIGDKTYIWEVKPDSDYSKKGGANQLKGYLTGSGATGGDALAPRIGVPSPATGEVLDVNSYAQVPGLELYTPTGGSPSLPVLYWTVRKVFADKTQPLSRPSTPAIVSPDFRPVVPGLVGGVGALTGAYLLARAAAGGGLRLATR
ncbi:MAG TPA: RHS repeat-associated core domain-containing protein, partial [Kineosporiaceae bacterium]|nr:RHS repeat-associated core domain-containing protein [Kineosporiaceae bacterium]